MASASSEPVSMRIGMRAPTAVDRSLTQASWPSRTGVALSSNTMSGTRASNSCHASSAVAATMTSCPSWRRASPANAQTVGSASATSTSPGLDLLGGSAVVCIFCHTCGAPGRRHGEGLLQQRACRLSTLAEVATETPPGSQDARRVSEVPILTIHICSITRQQDSITYGFGVGRSSTTAQRNNQAAVIISDSLAVAPRGLCCSRVRRLPARS